MVHLGSGKRKWPFGPEGDMEGPSTHVPGRSQSDGLLPVWLSPRVLLEKSKLRRQKKSMTPRDPQSWQNQQAALSGV